MSTPLRVGIIGASAGRGWAKVSHVPAVQGLRGLELAAVATNDRQSAEAAAKAFGVPGYADATALFRDPAINIIAVAVNVPAHRDLVFGALEANKHSLLRVAARARLGRGRGTSGGCSGHPSACSHWPADAAEPGSMPAAQVARRGRHRSRAERQRAVHRHGLRAEGGTGHGVRRKGGERHNPR